MEDIFQSSTQGDAANATLKQVDSSGNITSQSNDDYRIITDKIVLVFSLLGIPTNILSFCVLFRRYKTKSSSATFLLMVLAVVDEVYCIGSSIVSATLMKPTMQNWEGLVTIGLLNTVHLMTSWAVATVAFDRCLHICWPIQSRQLNTVRMAWISTAFALVLTTLCAWSILFINNHKHYGTILDTMELLAFAFVTILNALVLVTIIRAQHSTLPTNRRQSSRGSAMVVTMTVVFLFLKTPYVISNVQEVFYLDELAAVCSSINSSINMFVYMAMGRSYREDFMDMFRCKGHVKESRSATQALNSASDTTKI